MSLESYLKKALKKLKEKFPGIEEKEIERELIPLRGEEELLIRKKKLKK